MENLVYLLSSHPSCIEGVSLARSEGRWRVKEEYPVSWQETPAESGSGGSRNTSASVDIQAWGDRIERFIEAHGWKDNPIVFLVPAEDIVCRTLSFPFQAPRKIRQTLRFELEGELIEDLDTMRFSTSIRTQGTDSADVLVLLTESTRLSRLQKICLDRDLIIRNVDCSAYALSRSISRQHGAKPASSQNGIPTEEKTKTQFQIYLGAEETFVNTIHDRELSDITIYPNRIFQLLRDIGDAGTPREFMKQFAQDSESPDLPPFPGRKVYQELREELRWLCAQITRHLRGKEFMNDCSISIHGLFAPAIEWDGIRFKLRTFPLPEANTMSEGRTLGHSLPDSPEQAFLEDGFLFDDEEDGEETIPSTLEALMDEAIKRSESDAESEENGLSFPPVALSAQSQPATVVLHSTLLSLEGRNSWGVLGEAKDPLFDLHENHELSLYSDSTPWRRFIHRHRGSVALAVFMFLLLGSALAGSTWLRIQSLNQEIKWVGQLVKTELRQVFPDETDANSTEMLEKLKDKIRQRRNVIEVSAKFATRSFRNLEFLNTISQLLDDTEGFRIDQLEYGKGRFSISGSISSYDQLQLLKNRLRELEPFAGRRIVESNRKSADGIIYRISIDLQKQQE